MSYITVMAFLVTAAYALAAYITFEYLLEVWLGNEDEIGGPPITGVMMFFATFWPFFWVYVITNTVVIFVREKVGGKAA